MMTETVFSLFFIFFLISGNVQDLFYLSSHRIIFWKFLDFSFKINSWNHWGTSSSIKFPKQKSHTPPTQRIYCLTFSILVPLFSKLFFMIKSQCLYIIQENIFSTNWLLLTYFLQLDMKTIYFCSVLYNCFDSCLPYWIFISIAMYSTFEHIPLFYI